MTTHTSPRPHSLPAEKYFRWRAGEITRLEAFCDVVFGFAITLLVVSLEVPKTYAELAQAMRGFVPFAICFWQLVMIWLAHYRFSRRYGLEDNYTVILNMVLLFLVLFYVYPLKFVFTMLFNQLTGTQVGPISDQQASNLMKMYALGFASVSFLFALMYVHAYKLREALHLNALETHDTRTALQAHLLLAAVTFVAFLIAFRSPAWSGYSYFLIGVVLTIHGSIRGKRRRPRLGRRHPAALPRPDPRP